MAMTEKQNRMKITRDELRKKMSGIAYLNQIDNDYAELLLMSAAVDGAVGLLDTEAVIRKVDCRVKILKLKLDVNFRRLNKVLPDLKQLELTAEDENGEVVPVQVIIQAVDASAN